MKASQISVLNVKEYLRVCGNDDDALITSILSAAKAFAAGYTGLSMFELDRYEDMTIAIYVLCGEMYDNRIYTIESEKLNPIAKGILDMHSKNLL